MSIFLYPCNLSIDPFHLSCLSPDIQKLINFAVGVGWDWSGSSSWPSAGLGSCCYWHSLLLLDIWCESWTSDGILAWMLAWITKKIYTSDVNQYARHVWTSKGCQGPMMPWLIPIMIVSFHLLSSPFNGFHILNIPCNHLNQFDHINQLIQVELSGWTWN